MRTSGAKGELRDLYIKSPEIRDFIDVYESCVCSSCEVERLFSYFRRAEGTFMRKQLHIGTLLHLGRVYLAKCVPAHEKEALNEE